MILYWDKDYYCMDYVKWYFANICPQCGEECQANGFDDFGNPMHYYYG